MDQQGVGSVKGHGLVINLNRPERLEQARDNGSAIVLNGANCDLTIAQVNWVTNRLNGPD